MKIMNRGGLCFLGFDWLLLVDDGNRSLTTAVGVLVGFQGLRTDYRS